MKKLPAYTFVEILVALAIMSIVIVLAINLYFQLSRSNQRIIRDYDKNLEILQLKSILNTDFERYNRIEYGIYELKFIDKNSTCLYEFTDVGILRRFQEKIDTFKVEYSNLEYQLQYGNTGMVTHFSFDIKAHNDILHYSFYKEYEVEAVVNNSIFGR